jgi:N4-gp56 family major capsid protein
VAFASTTQLSNLIIPAYDRLVEFELREMPTFRSLVDRRPVNATTVSDTFHFTWYEDLAVTTTPLAETTDPSSLTIGNPTRTSVTIAEYGAWVPKTIKLQKTAFTKPDMEIAELLARQQADTIDELVKAKLDAGTNTLGDGTADMSAALVRQIRNKMRRNLVAPKDGANYVAHAHPDVTWSLMAESGSNVWASPHEYVDTGAIYAGEVGRYSAIRFVENTRCTTAGTGATTTYNTYVVGKQALVEANAIEPHTVIGPQTDVLRRHFPVGWYGLLGWSLFRTNSLLVVETTSALNA